MVYPNLRFVQRPKKSNASARRGIYYIRLMPDAKPMRILLLIIALVLTNCGGENKPTAAPVAPEVADAEQGAANAAADNSDATGTATVHPDSSPPADEGQPPPVEMASDPNALPTPAGPDGPVEGTFLDLERFPYDAIVSGGPAKDGIPALTNPNFVGPSFVEYLRPDDLVLGVVINGEARAYPHNIGWWHEIVNDKIGGRAISVTFCPLTGTGLVFDATDAHGGQFQLGVSGLLFNTNLVMYDRRDGDTLYPQMAFKAISGPRRGESLQLLPVVETTWDTWRTLYPRTRVIEKGLYHLQTYAKYPYGDYRTNHDYLLFDLVIPLHNNGNRWATQLERKERVLGVRLDGESKAYPFSAMGERAVINDRVGGVDIAVVWDRASVLVVPYARVVDGQTLTFDPVAVADFPFFGLRDRETGTLWDARGLALEGGLAGKQLVQVPAHNSMWFAWVTFWQTTAVWQVKAP